MGSYNIDLEVSIDTTGRRTGTTPKTPCFGGVEVLRICPEFFP